MPDHGGWLRFLDEQTGFQLDRVQREACRAFYTTVSREEISPLQLSLLCKIADNPGIIQAELARWAGLQRSTVVGIVRCLQKRGLVTRERRAWDFRANALSITSKGTSFLERIRPRLLALDKLLTSALDEAERRTLLRLLRRLAP